MDMEIILLCFSYATGVNFDSINLSVILRQISASPCFSKDKYLILLSMIDTVISKNSIEIRLTAERWAHIVEAHDYMAGNQDLVLETIESPDIIVKGEKNELIALRRYEKTSISSKTMAVIYKEEKTDGFIITAFLTSKPDKIVMGGVLWKM